MTRPNFALIKATTSIEQVMVWLGLKFHKEGSGWRASCPVCDGAERSLAIDIEENTFYCHEAHEGGSVLDLVMHVKNVGLIDAAKFIEKSKAKKTPEEPKHEKKQEQKHDGFNPLSHLAHEHKDVQAMGFPPEVATALGIGFASRGLMRGFVALPLRDEQGVLTGYVGVPAGTEVKTPTTWHGIHTNVVPIKRKRSA